MRRRIVGSGVRRRKDGNEENGEGKKSKKKGSRVQQLLERVSMKDPMQQANLDATVVENGIEKSQIDKRVYRRAVLENELEVLIVQDVDIEFSACALSVNAGSYLDPDNLPGLMHFCEHLLFQGTEKYPDVDAFKTYLSEHGGSSNAYTSGRETNYHFVIQNEFLYGGMDRFAQFFIAPLFSESSVDKELNAVDNEYTLKHKDDSRRFFSLLKQTSSGKHPFAKFSTGNLKTLREWPEARGENVREILIEQYRKYYSANQMKLVVVSNVNVNEMETAVSKLFSAIPNRKLKAPVFKGLPYTTAELGRRIDYQPVKDIKLLSVFWSLDSVFHLYQTRPVSYVSHLLGHEGPGSLYMYLKNKGWVNSINSELYDNNPEYSLFRLTFDLTIDALENHVDDIIDALFGYIEMIRSSGVKRSIYYEIARLRALSFRFKSDDAPKSYATNTASNLHHIPFKEINTANRLLKAYSEPEIAKVINQLTPQNVQIYVTAPSTVKPELDQTETWYDIKYRIETFPPGRISRLKKIRASDFGENTFHLPEENVFIADEFELPAFSPVNMVPGRKVEARTNDPNRYLRENLSRASVLGYEDPKTSQGENIEDKRILLEKCLVEKPIDEPWGVGTLLEVWRPPVLINADEKNMIWFKQDTHWERPRMSVRAKIRTNVCRSPARVILLTDLYTGLVEDFLNGEFYAAYLSGLKASLFSDTAGLWVEVSGYTQKIQLLVERLIPALQDDRILVPVTFERIKEKSIEAYKNWAKTWPVRVAFRQITALENKNYFTPEEMVATLESITLGDVADFIPSLFTDNKAEIFVHGATIPEKALEIGNIIQQAFVQGDIVKLIEEPEVVDIPVRTAVYYLVPGPVKEEDNSAITVRFMLERTDDPTISALLSVFSQIISKEFFKILRTDEQLGYLVGCRESINVAGVLCFDFYVQSNSKDPIFLDQRIEVFISSSIPSLLAAILEDSGKFDDYINACVQQHVSFPKTRAQEISKWWNSIATRLYRFNRNLEIASAIAHLTPEQVQEFYLEYFAPRSRNRKKYVAGVFARKHLPENIQLPPESDDAELIGLGGQVSLPEELVSLSESIYMITSPREFQEEMDIYPPRFQG